MVSAILHYLLSEQYFFFSNVHWWPVKLSCHRITSQPPLLEPKCKPQYLEHHIYCHCAECLLCVGGRGRWALLIAPLPPRDGGMREMMNTHRNALLFHTWRLPYKETVEYTTQMDLNAGSRRARSGPPLKLHSLAQRKLLDVNVFTRDNKSKYLDAWDKHLRP